MRMLRRWQWQHFVLKPRVLSEGFGAPCVRRCHPPLSALPQLRARRRWARAGMVRGTGGVSQTHGQLWAHTHGSASEPPCLPLEKRRQQTIPWVSPGWDAAEARGCTVTSCSGGLRGQQALFEAASPRNPSKPLPKEGIQHVEGGKSQRARQGGETSSPAAHPALSTPLRAWMAAGIAGSWRCGWMAPRGWESRPSPLRGGHPLRSASAGRRWESSALAAAWSSICSTDEESVIPLARKPLIPGCGRVIRHGAESKPLPGGRCCGERAWGCRQVCVTTRYFWPAPKRRLSLQIKGSPSAGLPCSPSPPLAQLPHLGNLDNNICPWELHRLQPVAKIVKPSERKGSCLVRFPMKISTLPTPTYYW